MVAGRRNAPLCVSLTLAAIGAACSTWPSADAEDPRHPGFTLGSPEAADDRPLQRRHGAPGSCRGDGVSPPLAWARPPAGTRSFVLLMDRAGEGATPAASHWVAYGMAAHVRALPEGESSSAIPRYLGGLNGAGTDYLGPCAHGRAEAARYVFTLIATRLEPGALPPGLTRAAVIQATRGTVLGTASLVLRHTS